MFKLFIRWFQCIKGVSFTCTYMSKQLIGKIMYYPWRNIKVALTTCSVHTIEPLSSFLSIVKGWLTLLQKSEINTFFIRCSLKYDLISRLGCVSCTGQCISYVSGKFLSRILGTACLFNCVYWVYENTTGGCFGWKTNGHLPSLGKICAWKIVKYIEFISVEESNKKKVYIRM